MYYFYLLDNDGAKYEIPYENISLSETLNEGMSGSLDVNYFAIKRYAELFNDTPDDVVASSYRYFELCRFSSLLFSGVLVNRQIDGSGARATNYSFTFCDWLNALERRITGNDSDWWYSSEDSADIAWDIIDQTQNKTYGDLGITRGLHPATIDRDRTFRYDNIRDEIIKMSNSNLHNGYDCEITPQKVFNIYYPTKGSLKSNLILDDGNIISWRSSRNLSNNLSNSVTVIGAGDGDYINTELRENSTSQETWGLQESTLSAKDVTTASILQAKGDKELASNGLPKDKITIRISDDKPDIENYNLGDTLPVRIGVINYAENLRVLKRTLQITQGGQAQVDLTFDYE